MKRARDVVEGRSQGRDAFEALDEIRAELRAVRGARVDQLAVLEGVDVPGVSSDVPVRRILLERFP